MTRSLLHSYANWAHDQAQKRAERRPVLDPAGTPCIWWVATSSKQQKLSPLGQLRKLREASAANGLYPVAVLRVPGHSRQYIQYSEAAADLAAYRQLLTVLAERKPKFLLCVARDRLGREALMMQVEAYCDRAGCKVWSLRTGAPQESIGQIYSAGMESTMSRAETRVMVERRAAAMTRRVTDHGLAYTRLIYGYRIVRDAAGKSIGAEPDPEQAPVLQWIDAQFVAGKSNKEIVQRLNARGVPSPQGKKWTTGRLRYLLHSTFPTGLIQVKLAGRRVEVQGIHEPLRTPETQAEIERLFRLRRKNSSRGTAGYNRWYGIAHCGTCGGRMSRVKGKGGRVYLVCGRWRLSVDQGLRPVVCSAHRTADGVVLAAVVNLFADPSAWEAAPPVPPALGPVRERLAEVRRQKRQAVRDRVQYKSADAEFGVVLSELAEAERSLLAEITELEAAELARPDAARMQVLASFVTPAWLDEAAPEDVRALLAGVVRVDCPQRPLYARTPLPHARLL